MIVAGPRPAGTWALLTDDRPDVRAAVARLLGRLRIEAASRLEAIELPSGPRARRKTTAS